MTDRSGAPPLSRREREVAGLVAEGLTDRQIADRLFISPRTAEGHVQNIRNKLVLDNRAQIATWATLHGLTPLGMPARAPAEATPHNLPAQPTSFVGRERELGEIRRLLQRARLLTITGPGGCGKTRLALQAAGDVLHRHPDGVWFVDLSAVGDPGVVPRELAGALGIRDCEAADPLEAVASELARGRGRRHCLVLLDNCEHLVAGCAAAVDRLLRASRDLTFVCTSREPLHVAGEAVWSLEPLSLPRLDDALSLELVSRAEAVQLFVDRAALSDPGFSLDEANAGDVARLCHQLDGLPLALELAAAHVGLMSFGELLRRLEDRLTAVRPRTAPFRQQTLSDTIGWSYDLLTEPHRRLLRRLSVFRGGFTLEAVEAVGADPEAGAATFELLVQLVDKSLVLPVRPLRHRYRCLDIIRRYAGNRLGETAEADAIRRRHLDFFLAFAEREARELTGPEQPRSLTRLEADHDNLRAGLGFSRDHHVELHLRLVLALVQFWSIHGHLGEGREWVEGALATSAALGSTGTRASLLNAAGRLALHQGDGARATARLEASLGIWRALGDRAGVLACLTNLGIAACEQDAWEAGRARFEEGLALARELGNERATALLLDNLGVLDAYLDAHEAAFARLDEALRILRGIGDPARVANCLANLGMLALFRDRVEEAGERYAESLHVLASLDAPRTLAECLEGFAGIAARRGRTDQALRLAGRAAGIRETVGAPRLPWSHRVAAWIDDARLTLGPSAAILWEAGKKLAVAEAVELALAEQP